MNAVITPPLAIVFDLVVANTKRQHHKETLVQRLEFSFPYDWSNPDISDEALIINVLKRGIFEDVCRICAYYGIEKVNHLSDVAFKDQPSLIYPRMIDNIRKGFALNG